MSFIVGLAKRYLFSLGSTGNSGSGFLTYTTPIAIIGVMLGVSSLLVVTSVMDGFEKELVSSITRTHSHIIVYTKGRPIRDPEKIREQILAVAPKKITGISPYIFTEAILASSKSVSGTVVESVVTDKTDEGYIGKTTRIPELVAEGRMPESGKNEIVVGYALAEKLHAKIGDTLSLVNPLDRNASSSVKSIKLVGILHLGMYEYDSKYSYTSLSTARRLIGMKKGVSAFKIKTADINESANVAELLKDHFEYPFIAKNWSRLNKNLLYAVRLEKFVLAVVLGFIILVASFNIVSTLMMLVHDKRRDLSILRAMGISRLKITSLFIMIGTFIGFVGSVAGLAFGIFLCFILNNTRLISLPPDIYSLSFLSAEVRPDTILYICLTSCFLAFLATLYPSYYISGIDPVEGLRYE